MYDLPSEDPEEPGLPDEFHEFQPELLRLTCRPANHPPEQIFIATDLNLYYDSNHFNLNPTIPTLSAEFGAPLH